MAERNAYAVAAVNPFWRYAVALDERPDLPAVPFFSKAHASAFCDESRAEFPNRTTLLLRRRPFGRVEVLSCNSYPKEDPDG